MALPSARTVLGACLLMTSAFLLTGTGCARKGTESDYTRAVMVPRMAVPFHAAHPSSQASVNFAGLAEQGSGGRIRIKVYAGAQSGSAKEALEQLRFGGMAFACVNILDLLELAQPLQQVFAAGRWTSAEQLMNWLQENWVELEDRCAMERMLPLAVLWPDIRCFYSDELELRSINDFWGKRIGISPTAILAPAIYALGAEPVDLVSADTYQSLRTGYMHARESGLSEFMLSDEYPFIHYVTLTRYLAFPDIILASIDALNDMSLAERDMLIKSAQKSVQLHQEALNRLHVEWIAELSNTKQLFWEDSSFRNEVSSRLLEVGGRQ